MSAFNSGPAQQNSYGDSVEIQVVAIISSAEIIKATHVLTVQNDE